MKACVVAWLFALVVPAVQPLVAQGRVGTQPVGPDMSSAPADIQAIMKKVMSGQAPTPDEAKRFNDYMKSGGGTVVTKSMTSYADSLRGRAFQAIAASAMPLTVTATISGAYSQAVKVTIVAGFDSATNESGFGWIGQVVNDKQTPVLDGGIKIPGRLQPGTYTPSTSAHAGLAFSPFSNQVWIALKGSRNDQGSYSLNITSVSVLAAQEGHVAYTIHGSLVATLRADPGSFANGTVTVTTSF
jgi:hypothetical protein